MIDENLRRKLKDLFCLWQCDGCKHANCVAEDGCQNPLFERITNVFKESGYIKLPQAETDEAILDFLVKIGNLNSVIERCEPRVCFHQKIQNWMVVRVVESLLILQEKFKEDKRGRLLNRTTQDHSKSQRNCPTPDKTE